MSNETETQIGRRGLLKGAAVAATAAAGLAGGKAVSSWTGREEKPRSVEDYTFLIGGLQAVAQAKLDGYVVQGRPVDDFASFVQEKLADLPADERKKIASEVSINLSETFGHRLEQYQNMAGDEKTRESYKQAALQGHNDITGLLFSTPPGRTKAR